jgi:hypothetical protein
MTRISSVVGSCLLVALSAPALAQTATPAAPASPRAIVRADLRRQIYVMEGALTRAVAFGAQRLNRDLRSFAPEMVAISGDPHARGVYLDGYGVFFDVGVPILHQSMVWSLRTMLGPDSRAMADALNVLKQIAKDLDAQRRAAAESALTRLEFQVGPVADGGPVAAAAQAGNPEALATPQEPPPARPASEFGLDRRTLQDPNAINRAYTELVQRELIDAMIDYGLPMAIPADEFLTVGARDNMSRDSLAPMDPHEEVVTILLRISGADLAAHRAGQIDRDEVRKRVQVREF